MHRIPLRTYERKHKANGSRKVYKSTWTEFIKPDIIPSNKCCETKHYDISNESLNYDPFETTFDRLAKDAIVPPIPPDSEQNKSWYESSSDNIDNVHTSNASLFCQPVGIPNKSLKSTTTTYRTRNKYKPKQWSKNVENQKSNLIKVSKKGVIQSKKTTKVEKELNQNHAHCTKLNKNLTSNENCGLKFNTKYKLQEAVVVTEKCNEFSTKNKKSNAVDNNFDNNQKINDNLDEKICNKFGITPSVVILNKESIEEKVDTFVDKEKEKNLKLSTHFDNENIQKSSLVIEATNVQSNPMCSTPIGTLKRRSSYSLAFSPISFSQNHSKELNVTNIHEAATQVFHNSEKNGNSVQDDNEEKKELTENDIYLALTQKYELTNQENKKINHSPSIIEYTNRSPDLFDGMSTEQNSYDVFEKNNIKEARNLMAMEQEKHLERKQSEKVERIEENSISGNNSVLLKLQDSFRVTVRRKEYNVNNFCLSETYEQNNNAMFTLNETSSSKENVDVKVNDSKEVAIKNIDITNSEMKQNVVFLKPGKCWARSLSILHNLKNNSNFDQLAAGKGKKWRHSVKDILDMQSQGILQSCTKSNEDDKAQQLQYRTNGSIESCDLLATKDGRNNFATATLNQLSRRISVRVVVDNNNVNKIQDTPFLKVYGITVGGEQKCSLTDKEQRDSNVRCSDIKNAFADTRSVKIARDVILKRCCQKDYIPFIECFPETYLKHCRKIGEGVYGEVFLYEKDKQNSVLKIIPIEGSQLVNGEPQKKFEEILSEIVIAKELHNLRFNKIHNTNAFVEVKTIRCIQGEYPQILIDLWKIYDDEKTSDNDCPSMFEKNQLYIALELDHGGQDLEAFVFQSAIETHALFVQTALALAVAERSLEFEHRDLHWGNVLISRTEDRYIQYRLDNKDIVLPSNGVKVSIIDFTLSRMSYQGCCIFNDLALDPALFTAHGEYQFEIYRLMRDKIENNWQEFEPYTNVLWLHYILDKMITTVRYKRKNLKVHKNAISKLDTLKNIILSYKSAFDFVTNCEEIVSLFHNNMASATEF